MEILTASMKPDEIVKGHNVQRKTRNGKPLVRSRGRDNMERA